VVLTEPMLRPELQDPEMFAEGITAMEEAQRQVALEYFQDGSIEAACPPVKAILYLMAFGTFEGMTIDHPRVRAMFTREALLSSSWYRERLRARQAGDISLWKRHVDALSAFAHQDDAETARELNIDSRLAEARRQLERVSSPAYLEELMGTIGADVDLGEAAGPPDESAIGEAFAHLGGSLVR
jgi:hypothetical protein